MQLYICGRELHISNVLIEPFPPHLLQRSIQKIHLPPLAFTADTMTTNLEGATFTYKRY